MNPEELQQKIAEYYAKLPKKAQEVFASRAWLETLQKISERHALSAEQIQVLGTETTLVLLGIIGRNEYEKILTEELSLPKEKLENILEEISAFILNPVITELSERYNKNIGVLAETEVQNQKQQSLEDKVNSEHLVTQKPDPRFVNLPTNIKDIINASNYPPKIYVLGKENNLTIAQITALEGLVTDTILGVIPPESFEAKAKTIAGLEEIKLKLLLSEINNKILKDIRTKILGLENKGVAEVPLFNKQESEKNMAILNTNTLVDVIGTENSKSLGFVPVTTTPTSPAKILPRVDSVGSIAFNKLAGAVKSVGAVTTYSLNNISKPDQQNKTGNAPTSSQKVDPYRMPTE